MNKYLIIADDNGKKQPAIHRGIELAQRSGAAVHLVAFVYDDYIAEQKDPQTVRDLQQIVMGAKRKLITEIINTFNLVDIQLTTEVVWEKRMADWIVDQTKAEEYSLMIKTGHRSETFTHTPADWQVFRESPIPVMIVANKKWRQKNTILCAIDLGSKNNHHEKINHKIIKQGKSLARLLNRELYCCYAIPVPTVLIDLEIVNGARVEKEKREKAQSVFSSLADELELDKSSLYTKAGKSEKVIPSIANKLKADMVVVGTVGRKGIKSKLLGNTAEQVVHHLRTDLLAIKP